MNVILALTIALYCVTTIAFLTNLSQMTVESKKLREQGRTPLVGKNLTTVSIAALAELTAIFIFMSLVPLVIPPEVFDTVTKGTVALTGIVFVVAYALRNVAAYLAAWGTWSVFVRLEKRKMEKQIEKDKEEAE